MPPLSYTHTHRGHAPDEDHTGQQVEQEHQHAAQQRCCHGCPPDLVADVDIQQVVALQVRVCVGECGALVAAGYCIPSGAPSASNGRQRLLLVVRNAYPPESSWMS